MVERELVVPVPAAELWAALTDPGALGSWFGATVEWELRPGGPARFQEPDGTVRGGRVEEVDEARRLRFRWWPEGSEDHSASEVTYELDEDPDGEGTRLVVTERPIGPPAAHASAAARWTAWDGVLLAVWADATGAVSAGCH